MNNASTLFNQKTHTAKRSLWWIAALVLLTIGTTAYAAEQVRTTAPFTRAGIEGTSDVELRQGDKSAVIVIGDEEQQKSIDVIVDGDRVRIRPVDGGWWGWMGGGRSGRSSPRIVLVVNHTVTNISVAGSADLTADRPLEFANIQFSVAGSGDIRLRRITADSVRFSIAGSGDIKAAGNVKSLVASVAGSGTLLAKDLRADTVSVTIAGAGDATVFAVNTLSASVAGVGSVRYYGNPTILKKSVAGMGSVQSATGNQAAGEPTPPTPPTPTTAPTPPTRPTPPTAPAPPTPPTQPAPPTPVKWIEG